MRRRPLTQLVLIATLMGTMTMTANANATTNPGPCNGRRVRVIDPSQGHLKVIRKVKRLIRCAVAHWPVAGGVAKAYALAMRESGFWPWARNPDADSACQMPPAVMYGSCGVFQQLDRYWIHRAEALLRSRWFRRFPPSPYNPRANVITSIRMAHNGGWAAWGG
jgi:hypothetical protein